MCVCVCVCARAPVLKFVCFVCDRAAASSFFLNSSVSVWDTGTRAGEPQPGFLAALVGLFPRLATHAERTPPPRFRVLCRPPPVGPGANLVQLGFQSTSPVVPSRLPVELAAPPGHAVLVVFLPPLGAAPERAAVVTLSVLVCLAPKPSAPVRVLALPHPPGLRDQFRIPVMALPHILGFRDSSLRLCEKM